MIEGLILGLLLSVPVIILLRRLYKFSGRAITDVRPYLRHMELGELESLVDFREEENLRVNLTPDQFTKAQVKRIRLLHEKLACAEHNVVILQEWAEYELERTQLIRDDKARADAEALHAGCTEFRIAAVWIQVQLHIWYIRLTLFPMAKAPLVSRLRKIDSFDLVESYTRIRKAAGSLASASGPHHEQALLEIL